MAKTMKKLDSKPQKQQQDWPKISNTARKYNKDENLENYDSEVQIRLDFRRLLVSGLPSPRRTPGYVIVNSKACL